MVRSADFDCGSLPLAWAIIEGLNVAYDVKETRAWGRRTLLAILLAIALAVLIITALALMFYGSRIAEAIANREVNAIIEQAAARAGDHQPKAAGKKLPDESARVRLAGAQSP